MSLTQVKTIPLKESTRKVIYKYFKLDDFKCQETGENEIDPEFVMKLDELRLPAANSVIKLLRLL